MDDTINTNFEDNKDELVIIVDEKNNFINYIRRKDMRLNNLWHRSSSIFVFTKIDNEYFIYIHKRSKIKDYCPSYYNIGFGGVLAKGETYLDNAIKELEEESGIKKKPEQLFELGVFKCDSEYIKSFAMSYVILKIFPHFILAINIVDNMFTIYSVQLYPLFCFVLFFHVDHNYRPRFYDNTPTK